MQTNKLLPCGTTMHYHLLSQSGKNYHQLSKVSWRQLMMVLSNMHIWNFCQLWSQFTVLFTGGVIQDQYLTLLRLNKGSFCRYRIALYFWSLGISLYLELFNFLSFITFVLSNMCSGTHRGNLNKGNRYFQLS